MSYNAEVLLDSVNSLGCRLTTMRVTYPLIVHAEMCRHRCFSRSVASNRAIPTHRLIDMVTENPFVPARWGANQRGMQAGEDLGFAAQARANAAWSGAKQDAVHRARHLVEAGIHKQWANRLLHPFQWVTEIVTGTDWENFFALRCHEAAQDEIRTIAEMMRDAREESVPQFCDRGEWHIPLILEEEENELTLWQALKVSTARCARTSYYIHGTERRISTLEEDLALADRLLKEAPKHASPAEHQAAAMEDAYRSRNFQGWASYRTILGCDHVPELLYDIKTRRVRLPKHVWREK